jgi:hypothetical protein
MFWSRVCADAERDGIVTAMASMIAVAAFLQNKELLTQ